MSERRSQHLISRVQMLTGMVDDQICLSKEAVSVHKGYRVANRFRNIVASAAGLLVNSPILLVVAIAIKVEDLAGPVFLS